MNNLKIVPGDYSINDIRNMFRESGVLGIFLLGDIVESVSEQDTFRMTQRYMVVGGDENTLVLNKISIFTENLTTGKNRLITDPKNSSIKFNPFNIGMRIAKTYLKIVK